MIFQFFFLKMKQNKAKFSLLQAFAGRPCISFQFFPGNKAKRCKTHGFFCKNLLVGMYYLQQDGQWRGWGGASRLFINLPINVKVRPGSHINQTDAKDQQVSPIEDCIFNQC